MQKVTVNTIKLTDGSSVSFRFIDGETKVTFHTFALSFRLPKETTLTVKFLESLNTGLKARFQSQSTNQGEIYHA